MTKNDVGKETIHSVQEYKQRFFPNATNRERLESDPFEAAKKRAKDSVEIHAQLLRK